MHKIVFALLLCVSLGCSKQPDDTPECEYCECTGTYDCDCDCDCGDFVYDLFEFVDKLVAAPKDLIVTTEGLPEWLIEMIIRVEEKNPIAAGLLICKAEWNKRTIFLVIDPDWACILCPFFTEDGKKIIEYEECSRATSKNWTLIYEYGTLIDFFERFTLIP